MSPVARLLGRLLLVTVVALALVLSGSSSARAQSAPQIHVRLEQDTAGVGEILRVEMTATSPDEMPTEAHLQPVAGLRVRGQNDAPSQTHIDINGQRSDRYTLNVDWFIEADRPGTYTLSTSVSVHGVRTSGPPRQLRIVPAGQAPPRSQPPPPQMPRGFPFSPFDPWKTLMPGFPGGFDDLDQPPPQPVAPTIDPKLGLEPPRGSVYFLHATVDKTSAVVGEQVTFSVYEYLDVTATEAAIDDDARDAQVPDFVKHPLLPEDQDAVLAGYASSGGHTWIVKLVRRWALFPLKAGDLVIGPMHEKMTRPRAVAGQPRTSETISIHVTEPPGGRPPGYALGDVGHFALSAQVQPREVQAGGAVGVHVELSGTGNLPATLTPAAREGVEWLTPETHDQLGQAGHDVYGGKRTFDFVVRMNRAGDVDLGSLAVPFWDPDARRYETARSALGVVHVSAVPGAAPAADQAPPVLPGLPEPRDALQGARPPELHADDRPLFWILGVAAGPLAFGLGVAGVGVGRRVAGAWRGRRVSPAADLKDRVALAHAACGGKDAREADAAIARALEAATIVHAGVNVRAAVGGEVADRLERSGMAREAAARIAELLRECEAARFSPDATDLVAARDRWVRAQGAIRGMEKRG